MNLYLRLIYFLLKSWRAKNCLPLETSVLNLRVFLNDLDINRHMNNGRFLTIMDIGRMDLLKRTGTLSMAYKNGWMPIVGSVTIDYMRPLKFWQAYELHSRIASWDEKWFYMEQVFYSRDKPVAKAMIKGLLRSKEGNVSPQMILETLQPGISVDDAERSE